LLAFLVDWIIDPWNLLLLCAVTWIVGKVSKRGWLRRSSIGSALIILIVAGYSPLSTWLISSLEEQYEPLNTADLPGSFAYDILVLGGGHVDDPEVHSLAQLELSSLARLTEGVRVGRQVAVGQFTLSGYYPHGEESHAAVMKAAAISLGIDRAIVTTMDETMDTMDEAVTYAKQTPTDPFILVTSAAHMPRSMKTFRAMGMNPIAAPTDFKVRKDPQQGSKFYSPGSKFRWFRLAMHEYIGMLYYSRRLR